MLRGYGIGSVLNDAYRLERELARGGLGSVFAGADLNRGGDCAIRVLPAAATALQVERERFLRDHRIIAKAGEPRLPGLIDLGTTSDGTVFVVTALWRGETLRQRLRRGPLPVHSAFALLETLCQIVGVAHQSGVPHGDLRPENVVTTRDQRVLAVDLGLHHFRAGAGPAPRRAPGIGWYLAPELHESKVREADARADVFSLGAILYEALTGRPAFQGPPGQTRMRERSGLAVSLGHPDDLDDRAAVAVLRPTHGASPWPGRKSPCRK